jgi:hypothetical protein
VKYRCSRKVAREARHLESLEYTGSSHEHPEHLKGEFLVSVSLPKPLHKGQLQLVKVNAIRIH